MGSARFFAYPQLFFRKEALTGIDPKGKEKESPISSISNYPLHDVTSSMSPAQVCLQPACGKLQEIILESRLRDVDNNPLWMILWPKPGES